MSKTTYKKGVIKQLSTNFKSTEFDCHGQNCCSETTIDSNLIEYLQQIRSHFNSSVTINSGYRCSTHNKKVGGVSNSQHLTGSAADIVVKGVSPIEVAQYAEQLGLKGIGLYDSDADGHFVHVDTRSVKSFWKGHAQKPVKTFLTTNKRVSSEDKTKLMQQIECVVDSFIELINKDC